MACLRHIYGILKQSNGFLSALKQGLVAGGCRRLNVCIGTWLVSVKHPLMTSPRVTCQEEQERRADILQTPGDPNIFLDMQPAQSTS